MTATQLVRKQRNERILDCRRAGRGLEIGRGSRSYFPAQN
jgi:hypothetical protein